MLQSGATAIQYHETRVHYVTQTKVWN